MLIGLASIQTTLDMRNLRVAISYTLLAPSWSLDYSSLHILDSSTKTLMILPNDGVGKWESIAEKPSFGNFATVSGKHNGVYQHL
jgi:hypothetical protein